MSVSAAVNGQCHYFLRKKRRYCRFQPKEGQQYCPEHSCIMGIHGVRKRIPCPLNPKHNCYEDELDKHVQKCNVTKSQKSTQEAAYYIQGINKAPETSQPGEVSPENKKVCVKDLTSAELAALIARVNKLYEDHVDYIETAVLEHPCVKEEFCGHEKNDLVKALEDQAALRKELLQQASLIGQLEQLGFLSGGHCFVEMGAGKGKLSHWIQKASKDVTNNSYLLIDRSSVRYKMDSFHKQGGAESEFKRIKVDIEDLCLGFVDLVESSKSVVVVGKHLCGGATDMGIRCAVETLRETKLSQHSSPPMSNSSEHEPADVNLKTRQHRDNLAKREEAALPDKPLTLDRINETDTTAENHSAVGTCEDSAVDTTGCSSVHPAQSCPESTSFEQTPNHITDTQKEALYGSATAYREDKVVDSQRKEGAPAHLLTEQEPPVKTMKLVDKECSQRLPSCILIALCCHHRCTWDTYVGQEFMAACGVSPQEFDLLTRLSSWATCAKVTAKSIRSQTNNEKSAGKMKSSEQDGLTTPAEQNGIVGDGVKAEDHGTDDLINIDASKSLREELSISERENVGRKCKRLIDTGRLHYLRSKNMKCCLRQYIDEELTPENVVLIAHIPQS